METAVQNLGISIIVCCYNSAKRLDETLSHIARQKINTIEHIELIVVDNNSKDNTADLAAKVWADLGSPFDLKVVLERNAGLSYARKKGIDSSHFDFLIFCDDDNWLDENYASNVYHYFENDEKLGVIGGMGSPVFEINPPFWFDRFFESYAVGKQATTDQFRDTVYGAGMGLRKKMLLSEAFNRIPFFLSDRKGKQLSSGGDSEICWRARLLGYNIYYTEKLMFKHFISSERLSWQYLKRLHDGFTYAYIPLHIYEMVLNKENITTFYWLKTSLMYFGRTFKYGLKNLTGIFKNKEGDEFIIQIRGWAILAMEFLKYNFRIKTIASKINQLKNKR